MNRTEETIKKDVVDQLYWDYRVDASDIKVKVDDQTVTLTGTVPTYYARTAAFDDAHLVRGVSKVKNKLNVKYPSTLKVPSDKEIKSNVKNLLLWNESIDSTDIDVSVNNGVVTLEGSADAYWKKLTAETVAGRSLGVTKIKNELAVVPSDSVVDKAIAKDIVSAIDRHYAFDEEAVTVKVNNGTVTLSGSVDNWYDYRSAIDIACCTAGVVDVEDQLVINSS
jgi:osmotically-inducible protein OsmY